METEDVRAVIGEGGTIGDDWENQRRSVGAWEVKGSYDLRSKEEVEDRARVGEVKVFGEGGDVVEESQEGDMVTETEIGKEGVAAVGTVGDGNLQSKKEEEEAAVRVSGTEVIEKGDGVKVRDGDKISGKRPREEAHEREGVAENRGVVK